MSLAHAQERKNKSAVYLQKVLLQSRSAITKSHVTGLVSFQVLKRMRVLLMLM